MPYLGIDTATGRGSIALAHDRRLLGETVLEERGAHALDLLPRLDALLRGLGLQAADLAGIGVTTGPGSFTGVRVGMATAKGLAYALGIGVSGLSTLEALALAALRHLDPAPPAICPVLEAGRGEVYATVFRTGPGGLSRTGEDRAWRPCDLPALLPEGVLLAGDGAAALIREAAAAGRTFATLDPSPVLAGAVAVWAGETLAGSTGYRPGTLRPNYVRPADVARRRRRP
ncbi:MAG: tRNA (adenosine(37)-N6)-threonylcarbamoyltransferase complex dimerization subunit type 1 TsaB [Candidatus Polarisedimenticolia bacterium]